MVVEEFESPVLLVSQDVGSRMMMSVSSAVVVHRTDLRSDSSVSVLVHVGLLGRNTMI